MKNDCHSSCKGVLCDAKEQENESLYTRRNKYFPFGDNMIYLQRISQEAKNKSFKRNVNSVRA